MSDKGKHIYISDDCTRVYRDIENHTVQKDKLINCIKFAKYYEKALRHQVTKNKKIPNKPWSNQKVHDNFMKIHTSICKTERVLGSQLATELMATKIKEDLEERSDDQILL